MMSLLPSQSLAQKSNRHPVATFPAISSFQEKYFLHVKDYLEIILTIHDLPQIHLHRPQLRLKTF
jgi:hypothetical protein